MAESPTFTLVIPERQTLALDTVTSLEAVFAPLYNEAADLMRQADLCKVTDVSQLGHMETAKKLRLASRTLRGKITDAHKSAKEDSRRKGLVIDKVKNVAIEALGKVEDYLSSQENFKLRLETQRRDALRLARQEKLAIYTDLIPLPQQDLADMPEADFLTLQAGMESRYAAEKSRRELEELGRQQKEKEEREKAEKLIQDNKRLTAAQELRTSRMAALKQHAGADLAPDDLAALSADQFASLLNKAAERKIELATQTAKASAAAAAQNAERDRLQKQVDDAAERIKQEDLAKQMERRQEQEAQDYTDDVKLEGVATALEAFSDHIPKMGTDPGSEIMKKFKGHLAQSAAWLRKQATSLQWEQNNK